MEGRILLTGGTGSLGTALLRRCQAEKWGCHFVVYSRDEVKQGQVKARFPEHTYVLGSVSNYELLEDTMVGYGVEGVIHAAAYKQVPTAEVNVSEAILTNVVGSQHVVRAAKRAGVKWCVGISTDKACSPVNVYGKTKALMEAAFQEGCLSGSTKFNLVRYGNVVGSRGSVIPLFQEQVKKCRPMTITAPEMTRFWLTLDQAVDLVLAAVEEPFAGTILVPKLPACDMSTTARAVSPNWEVQVIGLRPGEKAHEDLVHASESMHAEDIGELYRIWPAYSGRRGNLPLGYRYTSDGAERLSVDALRGMIDESESR